ncbi:S-adenosyl-L-methionine-dependent methyltransferase [Dissophora ornata]|nr:S-adenosyl-L-methionine-dependent methyltransferase [Dissophora ornata]
MLPNDLTESERLDAQHYIVRYCFQGNYNVKLDRGAKLKILDVATGTGVWALEMAHEFPLAEVHGIDISPIYPTPGQGSNMVPPNCHFQLCNLLDGLPFPDGYFDFVYQRLLVYALTPAQRKQVNTELLRILKPSGHLQLVESDGLIYNAGQTTEMVNTLSLETPKLKSVDPKEIRHLKPGLRRAGFIQVNCFNIALPVGDWGGPLGQLSLQNMHGLATIWLKGELGRQTQEECEATLVEIDRECEQLQSFYKVWLVVGQKPLLNTISHPPPTTALPSNPPF